jgi:5-methyltetrahydrofolate--homocysteine methyltransferase
MIETLEPIDRQLFTRTLELTSNFPLNLPLDQVLDFYQARLEATHFHGDMWPKWFPKYGAGILAGFLGAQVHFAPDTVWFEPPEQSAIANLQIIPPEDNFWWKRAQELTQLAVSRWQGQVAVGHIDLGGNLDVLASLLSTQQLLFSLYDHAEDVLRLSSQVTKLWLGCYARLHDIIQPGGRGTTPWAPIWSPERCYMLQSDFAYMISPPMFEHFVMPDLYTCCQELDHAFYHLDGKGQIAHLDLLLSIERLRGIQWIPGEGQPPPEEWLPLLKRILDSGKLCQLYVTAQGARQIVSELGGKGFALYITDDLSHDQAQNLVAEFNCWD